MQNYTLLKSALILLLVIASCKSREDSTVTAVMPKLIGLRTYFVPRTRTIFKFYCRHRQTPPDCYHFEHMSVANYMAASGLLEEYAYYLPYKERSDRAKRAEKKIKMLLSKKKEYEDAGVEIPPEVTKDNERTLARWQERVDEFKKEDGNHPSLVAVRKALTDREIIEASFSQDQAVSAGSAHTCALGRDGRPACWGKDEDGQVSGWKEEVSEGRLKLPARMISAGTAHTCALGSDGRIACWGEDGSSQVSGWKEEVSKGRLKLPARMISAGTNHTCALDRDGRIACWGWDFLRRVSGWEKAVSEGRLKLPARMISAGYKHTCALGDDGRPASWGDDGAGEVSGLKEEVSKGRLKLPARMISAGGWHTCALGANGCPACWGDDEYRQVSGWRKEVSEGRLKLPARMISAGVYHNCAVGSDGRIACWGEDRSSQVSGRDSSGYKIGDDVPEDVDLSLEALGYFEGDEDD